uniref:Macaca fascicularis brain cDNA clone: QflA-16434, similar to human metallothionein 1J (MT1J), mRNA, RefSeq: NM_175622.2 n=1 Tax=Macaca fascicularis TaxID=9541 RepID=I7G514_MACFA|nr:unnamed protein product [Macaca fascicularis]
MQLLLLTCLLQLIMVTNKAIASQISQIKHFFHCILVVVCPNSSMYLIMSGSPGTELELIPLPLPRSLTRCARSFGCGERYQLTQRR